MTNNISKPWVSRTFLKDSKLRTTERYWRSSSDDDLTDLVVKNSTNNHPSSSSSTLTFILVDAWHWRKYLRLIRFLAEHDNFGSNELQWVLLESTVELLDYRNQSEGQAAAPQERSILQKLITQQKNKNSFVLAFPDLSIRSTNNDDEWDLLDYEHLSIEDRSRQALLRAAQVLLSSNSQKNCCCWLVVQEDESSRFPLDEDDGNNKIKYMQMDDILDFLSQQEHVTEDQVERLRELKLACEQEYEERNSNKALQVDKGAVATTILAPSPDEIRQKLKTGQWLRGRLNVTKENTREAYVSAAAGSKTFFIAQDNFHHSFHQDVVIIEPLPEAQWGRPVGRRRIVYNNNNNDLDEEQHNNDSSLPTVPSARVVAIDQPSRRTFVATLTDLPSNPDESAILVVPMDVRIPKIRIRSTRTSWSKLLFVNKRLKVQVDDWEMHSHYPNGRCVEILGPVADLETEIQALLIENQVQLDPFSAAAMACLPVQGSNWTVTEQDIRERRDLRRSRRIFSVDPPGCQDIDDTMHAEVLPNGDIEVGVHIADVTAFVQHNSPLDKEAQVRGTTFYLVDRRFDMLPSLLSSDLCSLHGGVDRLAVSVIWTMSADLSEVKSTWYGRTVIHNCAAMTYDQADNILHDQAPDEPGKPPPPPLTAGSPVDPSLIGSLKQDLSMLTRLARKLRKDREDIGGAVDLSNDSSGSELKFTLESGQPTKVVPKQDKEIHHTIAEMMIMANTAVATRIYKAMPESALLRIHRSVEESSFDELREILEAAGVKLQGNDGASLAKSLKEAQRKSRADNSPFRSLLLHVATRAMTEAQYICTGDRQEGTDLSHFGLGLQQYTHFTSPIRRYADVVVHKQLLASLSGPTERVETMKLATIDLAVPDSKVVSILAGEGLDDKPDGDDLEEEMIDELIEGASGLVLGKEEPATVESQPDSNPSSSKDRTVKPYLKSEVSTICEGLNLHNRLAKHSSFECQGLFLSLYFKEHSDKTRAVVTSVRENGFFAYVPKYDLTGPVYVRDTNGDVQIDPLLMGLPKDSGLAPTMGFAASPACRRFPDGKCELFGEPEERLEIRVGTRAKAFVVRPFDVVDVKITCDDWDVRARVPPPRLQLVSNRTSLSECSTKKKQSTTRVDVTSDKLTRASSQDDVVSGSKEDVSLQPEFPSIFDTLSNVVIRPVLRDVPLRSRPTSFQIPDRKEGLKGRIVYGDFINPDTRSAVQEAAQLAAATDAAQRRANLVETSARRGEYDSSRAIERNITLRQQRLAAEKRHTRRSKAK